MDLISLFGNCAGRHEALQHGRSKRYYDAALPIVGIMPMAEDDTNYYGTFVRDPDRHKIEAVTYAAQ